MTSDSSASSAALDAVAGQLRMTGRLLGQAEAVQAAGRAFGNLLNPSSPPEGTP